MFRLYICTAIWLYGPFFYISDTDFSLCIEYYEYQKIRTAYMYLALFLLHI